MSPFGLVFFLHDPESGNDTLRGFATDGQPAVANQPAFGQPNDPFGPLCRPGIVGHHHDGATLGVKFRQKADHLSGRLGVEITGRLIGQNDRRIVGQHAGQGHPLLLSNAQF